MLFIHGLCILCTFSGVSERHIFLLWLICSSNSTSIFNMYDLQREKHKNSTASGSNITVIIIIRPIWVFSILITFTVFSCHHSNTCFYVLLCFYQPQSVCFFFGNFIQSPVLTHILVLTVSSFRCAYSNQSLTNPLAPQSDCPSLSMEVV